MSSPTKPELPSEEKAIVDSINSLGEAKAKLVFARPHRIKIMVSRENLVEIGRFAKDKLHMDHSTNVTATDFPKEKQFEVTYHLGSIDGNALRPLILAIACRVPSSDPVLPTLLEEFPSVEYHEREAAEMLGCVFQGHPNLTRLLLPEDWNDIPPMLKAYRLPGRLEGE